MPFAFAPILPIPFCVPTFASVPSATEKSRHPVMAAATPVRRILVPIGNGSEEIETACVVDTLRRAGAEVTVASVEMTTSVTMSRGMKFEADLPIVDVVPPFDAVALPGGMPGAERLAASPQLVSLVRAARNEGKVVAAICAAPAVVLAGLGMLNNKNATCYPASAFRDKLPTLAEGDVVQDGDLVTATGPGTALKWSLQLVEMLYSKELADKLAGEMLVPR